MANRFNVTPCAKEDLRGIWLYTSNIWGEPQVDQYLNKLYQRFIWLSRHPHAGINRRDICEGYHCFPQGSHLIFYLIGKAGVEIIGIPHKEMDILNYFDSEII